MQDMKMERTADVLAQRLAATLDAIRVITAKQVMSENDFRQLAQLQHQVRNLEDQLAQVQ